MGKNGYRLTPRKGGHYCEHCKTFRGNKRREYWIEHKCTPQWTARQVVEGKRLRVTHEDGDNQLRPQTEADQGAAATPKETQGAAQQAQSSDGLAGSDDGTRIGIAMDNDGDWDEHDIESESAPREAFPEPPEEPGREMMEQGGGTSRPTAACRTHSSLPGGSPQRDARETRLPKLRPRRRPRSREARRGVLSKATQITSIASSTRKAGEATSRRPQGPTSTAVITSEKRGKLRRSSAKPAGLGCKSHASRESSQRCAEGPLGAGT